ncbi:Papilin [Araneus ventricosus]|uniref:Papilin n=1 Tax=Araneus ventricosus TaxID=182803 RepID=A0A4Y2DL29_ARAVE|nr:Papilin [Araneus ventricosus]
MHPAMKFLVLLPFVAAVFVSADDCPRNSHHDFCGSACPLTCKNYKNPPKACPLLCAAGCHCDKGYVWKGTEEGCVLPEDCPPQKVCGVNEVYIECAELCPLTCDNYDNPPKECDVLCTFGCECAEGYVKNADGKCIKPDECPPKKTKFCHEKPDPGYCRGYYPSWYYDGESKECKEFIYGGCLGNGNRFQSKAECLENCTGRSIMKFLVILALVAGALASDGEVCGENERYNGCGTACPLTCENYDNPPKICPAMCKIGCECVKGFVRRADGKCVRPHQCPNRQAALDRPDCDKVPETGLCDAYMPRYYYNEVEGRCKQFIYGGCGGNRNNFKTEEECYNKCGTLHASNACEEDKEVGPCKAAFARFYFNKKTSQCEPFIYGGCGGNSNNFLSLDDCEDVCIY